MGNAAVPVSQAVMQAWPGCGRLQLPVTHSTSIKCLHCQHGTGLYASKDRPQLPTTVYTRSCLAEFFLMLEAVVIVGPCVEVMILS